MEGRKRGRREGKEGVEEEKREREKDSLVLDA